MSVQSQTTNLAIRTATEFNVAYTRIKSINDLIGNAGQLTTRATSTLVAALNGLQTDLSALQTAQQNATSISDGTTGGTTTWSSQKTQDMINAAIAALVNGAPTALDTLKELADQLANDQTSLGSILAALDKRVRVDAAQGFTALEQAQGRANIGAYGAGEIGNPDHDFVTDFNNALTQA
ncbi:hypothetical protein [Deinococcus fonticola]|uniref:hypothetical protein n=1 Tax=Deinococcus fonticola TaxID=2528713 RepID=UPI001F0E9653|nr:hypothetical protein [Deinococcus fonticola]